MRKGFLVSVLLILCLLLPAGIFAESAGSQPARAVIAGFEPLGDADTITVEYKLALVTLEKRLPAHLSVRLEGDAAYRDIPVTWKCQET